MPFGFSPQLTKTSLSRKMVVSGGITAEVNRMRTCVSYTSFEGEFER